MPPDPIRLLHFADAHIGVEAYGRPDPATGLSSRVADFFDRLYELRDYAAAHDVDLAIFAGDAFKSRHPTPTYQREFARFVQSLAALCPVILLVGNHDLPASPGKAASIEIYHTLNVPNTLVGFDYALHRVETKRGPVQVATAPYPIRAHLLDERRLRGRAIEEIDALLAAALESRLHDLAAQASEDPAPRVLAGHFSVAGAAFGSERAAMLGRDVSVSLESVAHPAWDYVALGHIHRHQSLTHGAPDLPPVVYSGSIERTDFGEEGEPKGFCWVELSRGATAWRFVELAARPFLTLRLDARRSPDPTAEVLRALESLAVEQAVVRLVVRLGQDNAPLLQEDAVRRALYAAGADHVAALQRDVERPFHARLGASPERLTPEALLERYFQSKDLPPDRIAALLEAARDLLADQAQ